MSESKWKYVKVCLSTRCDCRACEREVFATALNATDVKC